MKNSFALLQWIGECTMINIHVT